MQNGMSKGDEIYGDSLQFAVFLLFAIIIVSLLIIFVVIKNKYYSQENIGPNSKSNIIESIPKKTRNKEDVILLIKKEIIILNPILKMSQIDEMVDGKSLEILEETLSRLIKEKSSREMLRNSIPD